MMSMLINAVILVSLVGLMAYGVVITRRVKKLMLVLEEMEPLVAAFSAAVDKSQLSVEEMKEAVAEAQKAPAPEPAPAQEAAPVLTFNSRRAAPKAPMGLTRVTGKAELVKSFFEQTRVRREAQGQW
ncbi:hypothetical protein BMI87_12730 [Thioclava sp. F28-4]|nr:hypothetical protein BMI87_12730 [Thioclava sp. F28-4]